MKGRKMPKKIAIYAIIPIIIIFLTITGCKSAAIPETSDTKRKATELIVSLGYDPDGGFDPTTGWGRYGSPLFQSTLLKRDSGLNIVNDLALDYTVSDDGLVWTVQIRDDVLFSDGKPLTASDVQYTFDTASKSGSVIDLNILESVEAPDKETVVFKLKKAQSTFIHLLTSVGIVPEHAHGDGYPENPIGSGPFKLVQWDKGQQLIVEASPNYYGQDPYFRRITFLFLEEDAAFAAAKSKQVDMAYIPATFAKQQVEGMKLVSLDSIDNRGIMFPFVKAGGETEGGHPIGNDVTADPNIRKAVNVAVDRNALVEGVLEGFGTPAYTVCDRMPWWNPEAVIDDGDHEQAKKILDQGGWVKSEDGILEKQGLKASFTLVYPASDQVRQALALAASDMVRPLGIEIKVEGKSWDEISTMMYSNAVLFGWGSYDPLEMYNLYSSKTAGIDWYNIGFYSNPTVDQYLDNALLATSEEEAIRQWKKAQWDGNTGFSALGDAPWAWLVNLNHLYVVDKNLDIGNIKIQPHGHGWPVTDNIVEWKWKN